MAAFDGANSVTKAALKTSKFVPEIWQDEVIATYKKNIVVANTFRRMNVVGKKGDVVNLPGFTRGSASAKAAGAAVTLQTHSGTPVTVSLNQHWEYSRLIEDIAKVQSMNPMRSIYTEDGGYALAVRVDTDLITLSNQWNGGAGTAAWDKAVIAGDGSTLYTSGTPNANAVTDAGIRRVLQTLDDADVPLNDRSMVIPPIARRTMLGISRFTEWAFRGDGATLKTGKFGSIYGMDVYSTSLCPTATGGARIGYIAHKDANVLCEQQKPRVQTQYKQEFLADLLTVDIVYGVAVQRSTAGVAIAFHPTTG